MLPINHQCNSCAALMRHQSNLYQISILCLLGCLTTENKNICEHNKSVFFFGGVLLCKVFLYSQCVAYS